MQLHDLKPNEGAKKARKRVGRSDTATTGISSLCLPNALPVYSVMDSLS